MTMNPLALPDTLLSLGGMAMQALWWASTSGHCPRCGERTDRIAGEAVNPIPYLQNGQLQRIAPDAVNVAMGAEEE